MTDEFMNRWKSYIKEFGEIAQKRPGARDYTKGPAWWYYNRRNDIIMPMSSHSYPSNTNITDNDHSIWFYMGKTEDGRIINETVTRKLEPGNKEPD